MVSWRDPGNSAKKEVADFPNEAVTTPPVQPAAVAPVVRAEPTPAPTAKPAAKESVIAADLSIEGKIEGAGHVRIAGKFKGDVKVQGNLTIDQGARVSGGVSAQKVSLAGELDGNIESAQQVELLPSGMVNGDVKAGSLTVAAGSRIRGHVECGWDKDGKSTKAETGSAT